MQSARNGVSFVSLAVVFVAKCSLVKIAKFVSRLVSRVELMCWW